MFTIEHEFDATVVTLVDDGKAPLQEEIVTDESGLLHSDYRVGAAGVQALTSPPTVCSVLLQVVLPGL